MPAGISSAPISNNNSNFFADGDAELLKVLGEDF
jgi:hypothetical protein